MHPRCRLPRRSRQLEHNQCRSPSYFLRQFLDIRLASPAMKVRFARFREALSSSILPSSPGSSKEEWMQGSAKVSEQLNAALSAELTAIVQYMVQAEMCDNWGYHRLAALTKKRAIEEMHHAEGLIERVIFLDGTPEVKVALKPQIGANVKQHLEID